MAEEPRYVRAASHACGIATVGTGEERITVVVLPKAWRPAGRPDCLEVTEADLPVVTLYENQRAAFRLDGTRRSNLSKLLHKCAEVEAEQRAEEQRGSDAASGDWEGDRHGLLSSWDPSKAPEPQAGGEGGEHQPLEDILDLLLLEEAVHHGQERYVSRKHHPLLAPIVHRLFVDEIEARLRWMRRGYVERSERCATVRGRVDPASLGPALAARVPRVRCTFDAFTEHTPLFRIIATALDLVARGTWLDHHEGLSAKHGKGAGRLGSVRGRGYRLRRQLSSIPSYPLGVARERATGLLLPPMLRRRWGRALALAGDVLLRHGPDLLADDRRGAPVVWRLSMSGLWERILARALDTAPGTGPIEEQPPLQPPWSILKSFPRRRDLVFDLLGHRYVLDAKYAILKKTPSAAYLNQVFVYGLLSGRCDRVGLIYARPASEASEHTTLARPIERGRWPLLVEYRHIAARAGKERGNLDLELVEACFPAREVIASIAGPEGLVAFERYLQELGKALVEVLTALEPRAPTG